MSEKFNSLFTMVAHAKPISNHNNSNYNILPIKYQYITNRTNIPLLSTNNYHNNLTINKELQRREKRKSIQYQLEQMTIFT